MEKGSDDVNAEQSLMIEKERSKQWCRAYGKPNLDELERLARTEIHPNKTYIETEFFMYSPLGIACCAVPVAHPRCLCLLLENGADPLQPAVCEKSFSKDAFELAFDNKLYTAFFILLEYATYPTTHDLNLGQTLCERAQARHRRNDAGHVLAWLFTRIQHTEQIEPVVQRLAKIPLDCWIVRRLGGGQSSIKKLKK